MTTYVYESIVPAGKKPRYFELKQSMKDAPLEKHPETGEPIRRLVSGGFGVVRSGGAASAVKTSCAPRCGCH